MQPELTPEEKNLIDREFTARQEVSAKRRRFAHRVFLVAIIAGAVQALLLEFRLFPLSGLIVGVVYIGCSLAYVGGNLLPTSFLQDLNPWWHLNPWQDARRNLADGRTMPEAITLLAGPTALRLVAALIHAAAFGFSHASTVLSVLVWC